MNVGFSFGDQCGGTPKGPEDTLVHPHRPENRSSWIGAKPQLISCCSTRPFREGERFNNCPNRARVRRSASDQREDNCRENSFLNGRLQIDKLALGVDAKGHVPALVPDNQLCSR